MVHAAVLLLTVVSELRLAAEQSYRNDAQAAGDGRQIGSGQISLVTPARYLPAPGSELTIDYGAKSNEQLLFLYGAPAYCTLLPQNTYKNMNNTLGISWHFKSLQRERKK